MNKRKIFLIIAAFILTSIITSLGTVAVLAAWPFGDVNPGDWFYNDVYWLSSNGITQGCTSSQYCPNNYVTRAEMAAFLHREAGALVAAGVHIQRDGSNNPFVGDWFNNVNGVAPTVTGGGGVYYIDFGFIVTNRFPTCTIDLFWPETRDVTCSVYNPQANPTQIEVVTWDNFTTYYASTEFWVMLYGQ
ncbi:MAG: S-layer homology domain-containing protein [Anaerolineales bacterium]|nr:S-layer homology domain-containing protein [Anaerolineales bacterium]